MVPPCMMKVLPRHYIEVGGVSRRFGILFVGPHGSFPELGIRRNAEGQYLFITSCLQVYRRSLARSWIRDR